MHGGRLQASLRGVIAAESMFTDCNRNVIIWMDQTEGDITGVTRKAKKGYCQRNE